MQLLSDAISERVDPRSGASLLMETMPLVMKFIRQHMRDLSGSDVSVPQIRTLWFIIHTAQPSLSDAAEFIGLSLPAMSRLVDGLVRKGLVSRTACARDRRHVRLGVTAVGRQAFDRAWHGTHAKVTDALASLKPSQRAGVESAMNSLRAIFDPGAEPPRNL